MPLSTQIQRISVLCLTGLLAGIVHSVVHPALLLRPEAPPPPVIPGTGAQAPAPTPSKATPAQATSTVPGLDLTLEQAWAMYQANVQFIDARREEDFEAGHIEGALWIAPESFMGKVPEALNFLDRSQQLVVYCSGGNCDASHNVVVLLNQAGYKRCYVMTDGFKPWKDAGHPTAVGKPAIGGAP